MKLALTLFGLFATASGQIAPYCEAGPTSAQDSNLGEVSLRGECKHIDNPVDCPGQTGTQDLTAERADLVIGKTYTLHWDVTTCGGPYNRASAAWIDWAGTGSFTGVTTLADVHTTSGSEPTDSVSISFTVPDTAVVGETRLRVLVQESSATSLDPCQVFAYGGVKDFTVEILDKDPGCAPAGGGISGGVLFLIITPVVFALYCGVGFGLNAKNGVEGMDRFPNWSFWQEFPSYVATGFSVTCVTLSGCFNKLRGGGADTTDIEEY
jgi:hypothetical protein